MEGQRERRAAVLRWLPDGSYLSLICNPKIRSRRREELVSDARDGTVIDSGEGYLVRVVEYDIPNREGGEAGEIICVMTSILDPAEATAEELAAGYYERWECEGLIDEVKTHQRGPARVLRSKSPDMVRQEIWALLLTHYGIRRLMCNAADEIGEDPDRLSFMRSLRVIRRHLTGQADFSPERRKKALGETIAEINERRTKGRRNRTNPRVIKRGRHNYYIVKKPHHHGTRHDDPPTIRIRALSLT